MLLLRQSSRRGNSQGSSVCFGGCFRVPWAAGWSRTPLPQGMGLGWLQLPWEGSLSGTPVQQAGDPGGPGDPQGDPAGTPPARPVPISHRFHTQQPHPVSLPALPAASRLQKA